MILRSWVSKNDYMLAIKADRNYLFQEVTGECRMESENFFYADKRACRKCRSGCS